MGACHQSGDRDALSGSLGQAALVPPSGVPVDQALSGGAVEEANRHQTVLGGRFRAGRLLERRT